QREQAVEDEGAQRGKPAVLRRRHQHDDVRPADRHDDSRHEGSPSGMFRLNRQILAAMQNGLQEEPIVGKEGPGMPEERRATNRPDGETGRTAEKPAPARSAAASVKAAASKKRGAPGATASKASGASGPRAGRATRGAARGKAASAPRPGPAAPGTGPFDAALPFVPPVAVARQRLAELQGEFLQRLQQLLAGGAPRPSGRRFADPGWHDGGPFS